MLIDGAEYGHRKGNQNIIPCSSEIPELQRFPGSVPGEIILFDIRCIQCHSRSFPMCSGRLWWDG